MSWTLYRWTWRLRAPLYLGLPPAGSLNRTRLFVPARTLWGALTAELARHEARKFSPDYPGVGLELRRDVRFGYLFPAENISGEWKAWLPEYFERKGLEWTREDSTHPLSDRAFRRRVLMAKPGTSITPETDTAEDGSLRETECIQTKWHPDHSDNEPTVAMVGYVFLRGTSLQRRIDIIQRLFVGGDTRYGLGLIERAGELVATNHFFRDSVQLEGESPRVDATVVRGHADSGCNGETLRGAKERVLGWHDGKLQDGAASMIWRPGSTGSSATWSILDSGVWRLVSPAVN